MTLPPGQRAVAGFPRFGTHLHHPPPAVPADPVVEIAGAVSEPVTVPVAELAHAPAARADRRLPLRRGVVGHRPALGRASRSRTSTAGSSSRRSRPASR